ncbi:hypothetical protein Ancab_005684 [Ancistrocladus abbreviatus]
MGAFSFMPKKVNVIISISFPCMSEKRQKGRQDVQFLGFIIVHQERIWLSGVSGRFRLWSGRLQTSHQFVWWKFDVGCWVGPSMESVSYQTLRGCTFDWEREKERENGQRPTQTGLSQFVDLGLMELAELEAERGSKYEVWEKATSTW